MAEINFATLITHYEVIVTAVIPAIVTFLLEIYRKSTIEKENFNKVITLISYIDIKLRRIRDFANKAIKFDTTFLGLNPHFLLIIITIKIFFDLEYKISESISQTIVILILDIIMDISLMVMLLIYLLNLIKFSINKLNSKHKMQYGLNEFPEDYLFRTWKEYLSSRNLFFTFIMILFALILSMFIPIYTLEIVPSINIIIIYSIIILNYFIICLLSALSVIEEFVTIMLESIIIDSLNRFASLYESVPKEDLKFSLFHLPYIDDRNIIAYAFTIFGYSTSLCIDLGDKTVCGELMSITKIAITLKNEEGLHSFPLDYVKSITKPNKIRNDLDKQNNCFM